MISRPSAGPKVVAAGRRHCTGARPAARVRAARTVSRPRAPVRLRMSPRGVHRSRTAIRVLASASQHRLRSTPTSVPAHPARSRCAHSAVSLAAHCIRDLVVTAGSSRERRRLLSTCQTAPAARRKLNRALALQPVVSQLVPIWTRSAASPSAGSMARLIRSRSRRWSGRPRIPPCRRTRGLRSLLERPGDRDVARSVPRPQLIATQSRRSRTATDDRSRREPSRRNEARIVNTHSRRRAQTRRAAAGRPRRAGSARRSWLSSRRAFTFR